MSRVFPYPLLIASLIIMWLLLTSFSLGQFILGSGVALLAAQSMAALNPAKPTIRRWGLLPKLIAIVLYDIIRSNIAVARLILNEGSHRRVSGFLTIPLELRSPMGLAVLGVIVTSTPGTAWIDYNSARGTLLLHVFDLVDEESWRALIKERYEQLLLEIFE
jgi:multicomponent K+:H+ antiporter subunit E